MRLSLLLCLFLVLLPYLGKMEELLWQSLHLLLRYESFLTRPAQLCAAYRAVGGKTVAVLSCRPKLEMEELFDATIPRLKRHKTRFVFRQVLIASTHLPL